MSDRTGDFLTSDVHRSPLQPVFVEIGYAYPTSDCARQLKRGATGCWFTRRHHDGAVMGYSQLEPGTEYVLNVGRCGIRGVVS